MEYDNIFGYIQSFPNILSDRMCMKIMCTSLIFHTILNEENVAKRSRMNVFALFKMRLVHPPTVFCFIQISYSNTHLSSFDQHLKSKVTWLTSGGRNRYFGKFVANVIRCYVNNININVCSFATDSEQWFTRTSHMHISECAEYQFRFYDTDWPG